MFETGIRQFRMAIGMVWGKRLDTRNIANLVGDALATIAEFGEVGGDVRELIDGPFADPSAREDFANRALRRTARRLNELSPFYQRRFAAAELDPDSLDLEHLRALPVTTKRELIDHQQEFLCRGSAPHLTTRTTGTTGRPAEVWISRYELELWSGLSALTGVLTGELKPTDVIQVNNSSRATAAVHLTAAIARLAGAGVRNLGIVPTDEALLGLTEGGATLLACPPSYLGELVVAARQRGLGPDDFSLRRIDAGGEVLSESLRQAAMQTFGVGRVNDPFAMTEVIPVSASTCSQGHLHHDLNSGLVELLDLDTGERAAPGALATVVITPYYPYRECMPVFRYDTRDVVRVLPDAPLTCEIAGLPATGLIVGKADQIVRLGGDAVITPRAVLEAVESLPSAPWPARFRLDPRDTGPVLVLPEGVVRDIGLGATKAHLRAHGLDVEVELVPDELGPTLRHTRSDLRETTFVGRPALIGD